MHVQKIQPNQQTFGTRVQVDSQLVKLWQKNAKHAKEFSNFMNKLENNGKNDVMNLEKIVSYDDVIGVKANVYEIKDGKFYLGKEHKYDAISWYGLDGDTECVNLDKIYHECVAKMTEIKADFKWLPFL